MSIFIKSSNSLHKLAEALCNSLAEEKSVFQPVYIVSQTEGMNSWLKTQIAERTGIAANIQFLKPNDLINKIYFITGGLFEATLDKHQIQWMIYEELGKDDFCQKYPVVAAYYRNGSFEDDIKRVALAQITADLFDQYQVYRYQMLERWNKNELAYNTDDEKWQKELWRIIRERSGALFSDKSRIKQTIIDNLQKEKNVAAFQSRIPAAHFFGTSLITAYHHDILLAIAQHIPVYIYLPNPTPQLYWYEDVSKKKAFYNRKKGQSEYIETGNNHLLTEWGKLIQDTFLLFFKDEDSINNYEELVADPNNKGKTLLSSIQGLIHNNKMPEPDSFSEELIKDGSIIVQSCFSELREVETLYNYLIKTFDQNPGEYSPRDIVVQVTDINKYAAYIRAVFDNAPYRLRYNIADESVISSDSISSALHAILTLNEEDFTSEKVLQLLDFSAIRKRFKLTETELIRGVVADANIRHGIEGSEEDDSVFVSWGYGLKRIIYGLCMSGGEEVGTGETSFFPLDSTEGGTADEVIRFTGMVRLLIKSLQARECGKKITEWTGYVTDTINELLADIESENAEEYQLLIQQLKEIEVSGQFFEQEITYPVFLRQFLPVLESAERNADFGRGGITFCSLIPMRSIPFRIVAMLGLDFDKFPRKPVKTGFNLMEKFPQTGDRNVKINDKHLFLETLMSAGDKLYISYTGQNSKDNKNRPPSILTDELFSFIQSAAGDINVAKTLTTQQPLHGFSNKYGHSEAYYNYLLSTYGGKAFSEEPAQEQEDTGKPEIDIDDLYSFFSDSIEYYYKKKLGIYYNEESIALPETEMFDVDYLDQWKINNQLLDVEEAELETFIRTAIKLGELPLKTGGEYATRSQLATFEETFTRYRELRNGEFHVEEEFRVEFDGFIIKGSPKNNFAGNILIPNLSTNAAKASLRAWLYGLLVKASGADKRVYFIDMDVSEMTIASGAQAKEDLQVLADIFMEERDTPLPFNIKWDFKRDSQLKEKIQSDIKGYGNRYYALAQREGLLSDDKIEETFNRYKEVSDLIKQKQAAAFTKIEANEAE